MVDVSMPQERKPSLKVRIQSDFTCAALIIPSMQTKLSIGGSLFQRSKGAISTFSPRISRRVSQFFDLEPSRAPSSTFEIPFLRRASQTSSGTGSNRSSHVFDKTTVKRDVQLSPLVVEIAPACAMSGRRVAITSWHRLPCHLLKRVFHEVIDLETHRADVRPPALAQVCRSWRDASLSMPILWNIIYLDLRRKRTSSSSYLDHLDTILKRSMGSTLRIHIVNVPIKRKREESHPALDALISHSDRWRTATIQIPPPTISAFRKLRGHLFALESLELMSSDGTKGYNDTVYDMFEIAPQLRSLRVLGNWSPATLVLPWLQLANYEDNHGIVASSGPFIRQLRFIQDTDMNWPYATSHPYSRPTAPIILNNLETLDVKFAFIPPRGFFDKVLMPNLKELKIANYIADPISKITVMLARSNPVGRLRSFTCHMESLRPGDLSDFLDLVPQLEYLDISLPPVEDLHEMRIRPYERPLVPNLQTLKLLATTVRAHASELRLLAQERCEWVDHVRPKAGPKKKKNSRVRTLKSLTITFRDPQVHYTEREFLEDRTAGFSPEGDRDVWALLRPCKNHIMELIPWIFEATVGPKRSLLSKQLQALDKTFKHIETFELRDVRHLYVCR